MKKFRIKHCTKEFSLHPTLPYFVPAWFLTKPKVKVQVIQEKTDDTDIGFYNKKLSPYGWTVSQLKDRIITVTRNNVVAPDIVVPMKITQLSIRLRDREVEPNFKQIQNIIFKVSELDVIGLTDIKIDTWKGL